MARNQYGGKCYECGKWVEPGTGHFEKIPCTRNGWRVKHANVPGHGRITCEQAALTSTPQGGDKP